MKLKQAQHLFFIFCFEPAFAYAFRRVCVRVVLPGKEFPTIVAARVGLCRGVCFKVSRERARCDKRTIAIRKGANLVPILFWACDGRLRVQPLYMVVHVVASVTTVLTLAAADECAGCFPAHEVGRESLGTSQCDGAESALMRRLDSAIGWGQLSGGLVGTSHGMVAGMDE